MERKVLFGTSVLILLAAVTAQPCSIGQAAETKYRAGSGIKNAAIKKQFDCQWFHYKEGCNLKAKGEDRDEKCNPDDGQWVDAGGDYIELSETNWSGEGVSSTTGDTVTWSMSLLGRPTGESGVTVTALIHDQATSPSSDAKDPDATATKQMYAYQVVAYLNANYTSGNQSATVAEVGGSKKTIECPVSFSTIEAFGYGPNIVSQNANAYAAATWSIDTIPSSASLGTAGRLTVGIGASINGAWTGTVADADVVDGAVTVAVGVNILAASVQVNIDLGGDTKEGLVGVGFGFSSDDLGEDSSDKWDFKSSELADPIIIDNRTTRTNDFGYSQNATLRKGKGGESKAKAFTQGWAEAYAPGGSATGSAAYAALGASGLAEYTIDVPTYESGSAPPAEPGY